MGNHLGRVAALAVAIAWSFAAYAGGKEQGSGAEGPASLVITIDGLNKGQTLSVGIEMPVGEPRMDVITLSPGNNRMTFPAAKAAGAPSAPRAKASAGPRKQKAAEKPPAVVKTPEPPSPKIAAEEPRQPVPVAPEPAVQSVSAPEPAPAKSTMPAPPPSVPEPARASVAPAIPASTADGAGFRDCPECPSMVMVPAGTFVLGAGDPIEEVRKLPVPIVRPFAAGRFEVTYGEWSACVRDEACGAHVPKPDEGDRVPVTGVNFGDAKRYVQWLSGKTGKTYRLPTEAEWEYVARAGTGTAFWWGDSPQKGKANCVGCGSVWDGRKAAPVGSFAPNPFGVHDTAGNVWEWVEDCFEANAYETHKDYPSAVKGGGFCDRVLRGGGWDIGPTAIRSTFRFGADPQNRFNFYGFRVVRD
ncbi:MAG: SUMF1/EgtB/PvdO family nonheme iron enzyme [Magnetospirillum sp. WYHS-4]